MPVDDILAVTGRGAQNIETIGNGKEKYTHRSARIRFLTEKYVAIRDVINHGPCFGYFGTLMMHMHLGLMTQRYLYDVANKHWKVGAFWINYA